MDVPRIEYAPPPSGLRRRRIVRWAIWFAVVAMLFPVGMRGIPRAMRQVELLYWQRKAMGYTAPPDQVVFETDAARMNDPGLIVRATGAFRVAAPWDRFYSILSPPGRVALATLFVHERRNPRGESRLVVIEGIPGAQGFVLDPGVLHPGSAFGEPRENTDAWINMNPFFEFGLPAPDSPRSAKLRIFAGQPDPADASHFTIGYEVGSAHFTIDAWLRDDDTIEFERHSTAIVHHGAERQ
jgi:hypothetical protein